MAMSPDLLLYILLTCSVWAVHVNKAAQPDWYCTMCEQALNGVKESVGPNATDESLKSKLKLNCSHLGIRKHECQSFVTTHLQELLKELRTTHDVRTICVKTKACEPKELLDLRFYTYVEESSGEMKNEFP